MNKFVKIACLSGAMLSAVPFAKEGDSHIQKLLKDRTNLDFKIISNDFKSLSDVSFVIVESPSGERLALLASKDGSYIIPLPGGISSNNTSNPLKVALDGVDKYNKDMKDKSVLAVFEKNQDSVLKISASSKTNKTTYMILDTTCPYCLQEVIHLDDYLEEANLEIIIVGILGQRAQERASGYYAEFPNAKSREQKIALIKKVFEVNYRPTKTNEKLSGDMTSLAIATGIQGVPYIIRK